MSEDGPDQRSGRGLQPELAVYVAGSTDDRLAVQEVQAEVVAAGFRLTHDWTRADVDLLEGSYELQPARAAQIAADDLAGVLSADAVIVVAPRATPGRGVFVELGAALARAELGLLDHVVVVGPISHESVFYHHPQVRRLPSIASWIGSSREGPRS